MASAFAQRLRENLSSCIENIDIQKEDENDDMNEVLSISRENGKVEFYHTIPCSTEGKNSGLIYLHV